jgi:hypothetical protein
MRTSAPLAGVLLGDMERGPAARAIDADLLHRLPRRTRPSSRPEVSQQWLTTVEPRSTNVPESKPRCNLPDIIGRRSAPSGHASSSTRGGRHFHTPGRVANNLW